MRHTKIVVVNIAIIALCINIDNVHMIEIWQKFKPQYACYTYILSDPLPYTVAIMVTRRIDVVKC